MRPWPAAPTRWGWRAVTVAGRRRRGRCRARTPVRVRPGRDPQPLSLDLGVNRHDLAGALDAFTDGFERSIDIAEVNGRKFRNNVSLGIYGEAVRKAAYRDAKARTLAEAAEKVLGPSAQAPALHVTDCVSGSPPATQALRHRPSSQSQPRLPRRTSRRREQSASWPANTRPPAGRGGPPGYRAANAERRLPPTGHILRASALSASCTAGAVVLSRVRSLSGARKLLPARQPGRGHRSHPGPSAQPARPSAW